MTVYAMPKVGEIIAAKYRLDKVAGEGGMGIVYAAEHLVLKQRVAVKVLLPEAATSEAQIERFAREARAAAKINSEYVARVLDAGSLASGAPFLVMEYLEGCDLEELLALQKTLPITEVVDYLLQALEGLAHAHASNIVHRDLKPANLFLACRPDGTNAIKLLDFGISKATGARPEDKRLTGQHVLGSPVYMSPEQLRNATDIDARADIWSIGVVAYELLTGTPPFDGDGVGEIFAAILEKSPVPLTERNPGIPLGLWNVLAKCLRRDPVERWADAGQLARALTPFSSDPETPVASRAEHVLARAKRLAVVKTPVEARRVVEAIDAAAERAITTTAGKGSTVLPLSRVKKEVPEAFADTFEAPVLPGRKSRLRAAIALASITLIVGIGALGAVRARSADRGLSQLSDPANAADHRVNAPASSEKPDSADTAESGPPLLMDLPPTPNGDKPARARGSKTPSGSRPQRPKFLNTRE